MYSINTKLDGVSVFITEDRKKKEEMVFSDLLIQEDCLSTIQHLVETYEVSDTDIYLCFQLGVPYFRKMGITYYMAFRRNANEFCRAFHYSSPEHYKITYRKRFYPLKEYYRLYSKSFSLFLVSLKDKEREDSIDLYRRARKALREMDKRMDLHPLQEEKSLRGIIVKVERRFLGRKLLLSIENTLDEIEKDAFLLEEMEEHIRRNPDNNEGVEMTLSPLRFPVIYTPMN